MLNLFQHLVISTCYETLKSWVLKFIQDLVRQGDTIGLFTNASSIYQDEKALLYSHRDGKAKTVRIYSFTRETFR